MDDDQDSALIKKLVNDFERARSGDLSALLSCAVYLNLHGKWAVERELRGSYGVVLLVRNTAPNSFPRRMAIKTFRHDLEGARSGSLPLPLDLLFEREARLCLQARGHRNLLYVSQVTVLQLLDGRRVPAFWMPCMDSDLEQWLGEPRSLEARLYVLAQASLGVAWLHRVGLQGHGDLKPQNILIQRAEVHHTELEEANRWRAVVSDLGWADIWRDYHAQTERAWRPFVAPERMHGEVASGASDVFALGVIATLALSGAHPYGAPLGKVNALTREKYRRWAESVARNLDGIADEALAASLRASLAPAPSDRPSARELAEALAQSRERLGWPCLGLLSWSDRQAEEERSSPSHMAWAAQQLASLSDRNRAAEFEQLAARVAQPPADTTQHAAAVWLLNARTAVRLCPSVPEAHVKAATLVESALTFIVARWATLDLREPLWGALGIAESADPREPLAVFIYDLLEAAQSRALVLAPELRAKVAGLLAEWEQTRPAEVVDIRHARLLRLGASAERKL